MRLLVLIFILCLNSFTGFAQVHLGSGQSYVNIENAANSGAIQAGDTVFLHGGSYGGYQSVLKLKGNSSKWIVITAYNNEIIDISGTWQFMACEYIKFVNLTFKGNAKYPGRLLSVDNNGSCDTRSKFIIVDSCRFSNTTEASAITAFKFSGVDSFEVKHCIFKDFPVCDAMDYNVCHNGIITDNRFENCLTGGHIKGGASNITMERNLFINSSQASWVAFEIGGDTGAQFYCPEDKFEVKNIKFYSNIIIGGYRGLALSSAVDCKVINNTFYNCGQATMRFLTTSSLFPTLSGNKIENNIFAFGSSEYMNGGTQPAGAASFSNNIYYSISKPTFNGPYWDTPDLDAIKDRNPMNFGSNTIMFMDGVNGDFHLAAGSPAIAAGTNETEPATDFYGNPFKMNGRSIGAIEVKSSTGVSERDELNINYSIYPNPAKEYIELSSSKYVGLIAVYSPLGIKVLDAESNAKIDIHNLPAGIYFLKIGDDFYRFVKL